jgi:hypothetical protein
MSDMGEVLKQACDDVLTDPELAPKTVKGKLVTHCNQAAERVALAMGCSDLCAMDADEQYAVMNGGGDWRKVCGSEATIHALDGGLAFAAMTDAQLEETHGHIAAVYPEGMQASGSLGYDVPLVANVGKSVGVMRSTGAFPPSMGEADYFVFRKEE